MEKRLLKSVTLPKADHGRIRETALNDKKIIGVIVSQQIEVKGIETLVLNIFQVSGRNKNDISLQFRVFCQKEDYISLEVENGKWRTGALLNLVCSDSGWSEYWWNYNQLEFLTEQDSSMAERVFRKWDNDNGRMDGKTAFAFLDRYQSKIKSARLEKKHKKITDVIDVEMEKFGELPDDYQDFVEETVFKDDNYIFYDTDRKRAFCTSCKKTFLLENKHLRHEKIGIRNDRDEVRHNRTVACPYCHKFLTAKSEGMGRKSLVLVQWSVLVQKNGEEVLTRYFCHIKDFRTDFHNPKISTSEGYRTVHSAEKSSDYMWAHFKLTGKMRWCYYRDRGSSWYPPAETVAPRSAVMYNTTLQETVADTCMKYSAPDIFVENLANDRRHFNSPWLIDRYFNEYRKYPFIEQLLKVGFFRLTMDFLEKHYRNHQELYGGHNSILGTLGVNKYQFNMLRKVGNPRMRDLEILRFKPDLKWDDFQKLRYVQDNGRADSYKKYIHLMSYTTLHKLFRYIDRQGITCGYDYFDYAEWIEEMGYDMKNEFNLFPKDFKKAHDEKSKEYIEFRDNQAIEEAKAFNKLLEKMRKETETVDAMNLNVNGLFIRLPNQLDELKEEGEALHHCVGAYAEKVRKGETMIFFIRKKIEPEKPYYTLEWHGRVVQCRGFRNCDMTSEVQAFAQIFQQKMIEYANAPKKKNVFMQPNK